MSWVGRVAPQIVQPRMEAKLLGEPAEAVRHRVWVHWLAAGRVEGEHGGRCQRLTGGAAAGPQGGVEAVDGGGVQAPQRDLAERGQDRAVDVALVGDRVLQARSATSSQRASSWATVASVAGRRPSLTWVSRRARSAWASRLVRAVPVS
jgi:hypothetical protein